MTDTELHPDAEKRLRILILNLWEFQTEWEDEGPLDNPKYVGICDGGEDLMIKSLNFLGFDCIEDFEESVWVDKPTKPLTPPTGVSQS
jgi:hypothetical protein